MSTIHQVHGEGPPREACAEAPAPDGELRVLPVRLVEAGVGEARDPEGNPQGRVIVATIEDVDGRRYRLGFGIPEAAGVLVDFRALLLRELAA